MCFGVVAQPPKMRRWVRCRVARARATLRWRLTFSPLDLQSSTPRLHTRSIHKAESRSDCDSVHESCFYAGVSKVIYKTKIKTYSNRLSQASGFRCSNFDGDTIWCPVSHPRRAGLVYNYVRLKRYCHVSDAHCGSWLRCSAQVLICVIACRGIRTDVHQTAARSIPSRSTSCEPSAA